MATSTTTATAGGEPPAAPNLMTSAEQLCRQLIDIVGLPQDIDEFERHPANLALTMMEVRDWDELMRMTQVQLE